MDGLLKRACDNCTQSKVKCSGHEPCKRCSTRGIVCVYRPKRKRGPQKKRPNGTSGTKRGRCHTAPKQENDHSFSSVSSYERRIWSVFFTIFKNQNRTREEHPWAWCWFASQLEKLRIHLEKTNNVGALKRLSVWLEAVDLDQKTVSKLAVKKCSVEPSMCGACSSAALGLRNPPSNLMAAVNSHGSASASLKVTTCSCSHNQPAKSNTRCGLHRKGSGIKEMQLGGDKAAENGKAYLIFDACDDYSTVKVNKLFVERYGYDSEHMTSLLSWSGGGFLPWGGDLLAKLLVKESDLIIFLQILALKFQAIGVPDHNKASVREIPTTHVFLLWTKNPVTGELGYVQECFMRFIHMESFDNQRVVTQMRVAFDPVDDPHPPDAEYPRVYMSPIAPGDVKKEIVRRNQNSTSGESTKAVTPIPLYSPPEEPIFNSTVTSTGPGNEQHSSLELEQWLNLPAPEVSQENFTDTLGPEFKDEFDWQLFGEQSEDSDTQLPPLTVHPVDDSSTANDGQNVYEEADSSEAGTDSFAEVDEEAVAVDWLDSLLEWTTQRPALESVSAT